MSDTIKFEDYLDKYGKLTYSNKCTSMMPLLKQGRDLFTVKRKNGRCAKGDVVLYKRPPESYVLHRVIEVRKNSYVILGDNCINKEYGIKDKDIIGVMISYVRKGKAHSVNDLSYKLYSRYIMATITPRVFLKRIKLKLKRIVKRLIYER